MKEDWKQKRKEKEKLTGLGNERMKKDEKQKVESGTTCEAAKKEKMWMKVRKMLLKEIKARLSKIKDQGDQIC